MRTGLCPRSLEELIYSEMRNFSMMRRGMLRRGTGSGIRRASFVCHTARKYARIGPMRRTSPQTKTGR
eukprot:865805-Pleurochrysis_carterae.AAC.1